jgi:hypothetical protein
MYLPFMTFMYAYGHRALYFVDALGRSSLVMTLHSSGFLLTGSFAQNGTLTPNDGLQHRNPQNVACSQTSILNQYQPLSTTSIVIAEPPATPYLTSTQNLTLLAAWRELLPAAVFLPFPVFPVVVVNYYIYREDFLNQSNFEQVVCHLPSR